MSTPDQAGPGRPARLAGLALLAVAAIALVVGVISLVGGNGDDPGASPPPSSESQQPPPTEQPSAPPPPTSAQPPTSAPPTPPPSTSATPPTPSPTGPDRSQPVRVYNNSNIKGLADDAATDLRGVGWQITEVGNYPGGVIATTTVYYRPGTPEEAAAKEMAKEFGIRPEARFQGIQDAPAGIIVIVTREYKPRSK